MKLTKAKLIKLVKPTLEGLNYLEFKESISGFQGFFSKKLENGLYLTLGLVIHRYYDSMFTAEYYLSKTTRLGSIWGDIPRESEIRPSYLLTDKERSIYAEDEINVKGTHDIWWNGNNEEAIADFIKVIKITEPRFINQPELIKKIEQSKELQTLSIHADKVIRTLNFNLMHEYKFLPNKEIDGIPIAWFEAAERVLKESNDILNANTVKILASDAFKQYKLKEAIVWIGKVQGLI